MATNTRTYTEWRSSREAARARCDEIDALLPAPQRVKLRDPDEAEFLRSIGTPEGLIGPVPDREQLAAVQARLLDRSADTQDTEEWLWYRPNPAAGGRPPIALLTEGRFRELLDLASRV